MQIADRHRQAPLLAIGQRRLRFRALGVLRDQHGIDCGQHWHRDGVIDGSSAVLIAEILATVSVSVSDGEAETGKLNEGTGDSPLLLRRLLLERVPLEGNCPAI